MTARRLRFQDYTVGWVCALPIELAAATKMLDEEHQTLPPDEDDHDTNIYTLGRIGEHNIVLACMPAGQTGTNSASAVAMQMKTKFISIRFGLMVGIGGGVPSAEADIRLGDVVISQPHMQHGGVVQYDFGKTGPHGFTQTGSLNAPPTVLLTALSKLRSNHYIGRNSIPTYLSTMSDLPHFTRVEAGPDILFQSNYNHVGGPTCDHCSRDKLMDRTTRSSQEITIHYGTIASGNQVMKDGVTRDRLSAELGSVLCFEMEAAGLMNRFPCIVIRGICDYADSHKNKKWQPYAAATAAACAKELLSVTPSAEVAKTRTVGETIQINDSTRINLLNEHLPLHQLSSAPAVVKTSTVGKKTNTAIADNIFRQLSPADFHPGLARIEDTRCPETGLWLRKDKTVLDWLSGGPGACLLLTGGPGSGKTYLMAGMIRYLDLLPLKDSGVAVTYFMFDCKGEDSSRKLSLAVLQTITAQLFVQVAKSNLKFVETRLEAIADSRRKLQFVPRNQLVTMLREAIQQFSMTYLILDALDECEDVPELLRFIRPLVMDDGPVKLLLSSQNTRHIPELVTQLPSKTHYRLVLDAQTMRVDITQLIKFRTETMDIEDVGSPLETNEILVTGSHGLILLAKLRLDTLEQKLLSTDADVETALKQLPIGVHQYYEQALARLSEEDRLLARDMFTWVLYTQETLSLEELIEASLLVFDGPGMRPAKLSKRGIRRLGAGLVEVVDNQVTLSHTTVRDFALDHDWKSESPSKIPDQNEVHSRIAAFLLDYMSQSELVTDILSSNGLALMDTRRWPLLDYAVKYWLAHLRLAARQDTGLVRRVDDFIESNKSLAWWIQYTGGVDSYNWWSIPQVSSDLFASLHQRTLTTSFSQTSVDLIAGLCERHVCLLESAHSERQLIAHIYALNRFAHTQARLGRLEKARELLNQAIKVSEELPLEINEAGGILSLISLCVIDLLQGNFSNAISLCDRIDSLLNLSKIEHNRYFVETSRIRGVVENSRYHSKLAAEILRKAHNHASMTLGDQDPYTLATRNDLALTCLELGKLAEAEELLDIAYYEAVLGKEHPSTLTGAANFAAARRSAGHLDEAERLCSNIYARRIEIQGPKSEDTIHTGSLLSAIYVQQGKLTNATNLQQSLMMQFSAPKSSDNQLITLSMRRSLAEIKRATGKLQESEELLRNQYQMTMETHHLGPRHPWTIEILESLAHLKREKGESAEAESLQMDVLQFRTEAAEEGDPQLLKAKENLALIKQHQGQLVEAEQLQEQLLNSWKEIGDKNGPNVLNAMTNLAVIKRERGNLEDAEKMEEQVLKAWKQISKEDSPLILTAMANLAITKGQRGKLEEEETMEEHVLKARRQISGEDSPAILTTMANLAITKRARGKLEEAEIMEEQVLKARRQISGEDSPFILTAMANLAITKGRRGKLEEEEMMEEHVLEARRQISGEDSPAILTAMANLAITKQARGKLKEAEILEEQVLKARRQISGENSPAMLVAMGSLAITKRERSKLEEAEIMGTQVLEARKLISGEDSPAMLIAMGSLAITKRYRGKLEEAEKMEEHVLKARRQISEGDTSDVLTAMANLALTKSRRSNLEDAEIMEEYILKARRQISGEDGPDTLISLANLALTKRRRGKIEEAETMEEQVLKARRQISREDNPNVLTAIANLAITKRLRGKLEEAETMEKHVLNARRQISGEDSPNVLAAMENLADTYTSQLKLDSAEELYTLVIEGQKNLYEPEAPQILNAMSSLAFTICEQGRHSAAEKLQKEVLESRRRQFGEVHPDVLTDMIQLSRIYDAQLSDEAGNEAGKLLKYVYETRLKLHGPEHVDTIDVMGNLASDGNLPLEESEKMHLKVLEWRTKFLGPEDLKTISTLYSLALNVMLAGRHKQGEELLLRVVPLREKILGADSFETSVAREYLALSYAFQGRKKEAIPLITSVVDVRMKLLGEDHRDTKSAKYLLSSFS